MTPKTKPLFPGMLDALLNAGRVTRKHDYLDPERLVHQASRKTGFQDFGNAEFLVQFEWIANSINKNGDLNAFGKFAMRNYLLGNLVKRLNITEFLKRKTEIARGRIESPIFITGWYRTGTTYLHHRIFQHAPDTRAPLLWELMNPCPDPVYGSLNPGRQVMKTRLTTMFQRWISPEFQSVHPLDATMPDECLHLMEIAGLSSMTFFLTEDRTVAERQLAVSQVPAYQFYRKQLQLLHWQRPGKRWLLKWPYHLWHLDALFTVFPDAKVIWLQRDPRQAVPSVCNLAELAKLPFCNGIDRNALGQFWLNYNRIGQERAANSASRGNTILKIDHADLLQDETSVLEKISRFTGMEINPPQPVNQAPANMGQHYSAEDYGVSEESIDSHFG